MLVIIGATARWLAFVWILTVVGSVAFRFFVLPRAALTSDRRGVALDQSAAVAMIAAVVGLATTFARIVVQTGEMRFPDDSWFEVGTRLALHTSWGKLWLFQVSIAVALIPTFAWARRSRTAAWALAALLGVALATTFTMSSHAMSAHGVRFFSVGADLLHVLGASTWLGALGMMLFTVRARRDGEMAGEMAGAGDVAALLRAFSPVALASAGTVVSSGVISAFIQVGSWDALLSSRYGRTLVIKVVVVLAVALLGFRNWRRLTPGVHSAGTDAIQRGMIAELAAALVVLLVTALLVASPRPMDGMPM